jgi:hypothetical protein
MMNTGRTSGIDNSKSRIWNLKSIFFVACVLLTGTAHAQQRPLVTEDPETIGPGHVLLEGGFSLNSEQSNFVNGLRGDISRLASFGASIGIGAAAEVQIDGGIFQRLTVTERLPHAPLETITLLLPGDSASSMEDLIVATKVRLVSETPSRPALGIRFGTKLPTAAPDKGIGIGTTDFFASFLIAKTVRSVRTVGNAGLLVLSNPVTPGDSANALGYGVSIARAVTNAFELVGEVNGRLTSFEEIVPGGPDSRAVLRFAGRYTYAMLRLDFGILAGITNSDPNFGISAGATYVITR